MRHAAGTVRRVAADTRLQVHQVEEYVRLPAQLVGDHRRLGMDAGDHRHPHALALHRLHQRAEIAVAGKDDDVIDMG